MNFYDRWGRVEGAGTKSPNFDLMARDIANDVHDALTGRRHRDDSAASHPEFFTPITRGPMKDRTFNIPDRMIEDFLESNVREVGERYARTMAGEVELTRRFGRADMRDQLTEIGHQYRDLRDAVQAAKTPEEIKGLVGCSPGFAEGLKGKLAGQDELTRSREAALSFLDKDELSARNDLTSVRDLVRGMPRSTPIRATTRASCAPSWRTTTFATWGISSRRTGRSFTGRRWSTALAAT